VAAGKTETMRDRWDGRSCRKSPEPETTVPGANTLWL
jgi:hypothetical protein